MPAARHKVQFVGEVSVKARRVQMDGQLGRGDVEDNGRSGQKTRSGRSVERCLVSGYFYRYLYLGNGTGHCASLLSLGRSQSISVAQISQLKANPLVSTKVARRRPALRLAQH